MIKVDAKQFRVSLEQSNEEKRRVSSSSVEGWGGSGCSGVDAELEAWCCKWVLHKRVGCTRWFACAARLPCLIDFDPGEKAGHWLGALALPKKCMMPVYAHRTTLREPISRKLETEYTHPHISLSSFQQQLKNRSLLTGRGRAVPIDPPDVSTPQLSYTQQPPQWPTTHERPRLPLRRLRAHPQT